MPCIGAGDFHRRTIATGYISRLRLINSMMDDIRRLYSEGGIREVCKGGVRFIYFAPPINSAARFLMLRKGGSVTNLTVNGVSAKFHVTTDAEFDRLGRVGPLSEQAVLAELINDINGDEVFFDIGANVGVYSCFVGNKMGSGSVYAFEPHPNNLERLYQNVELNEIEDIVSVQEYALSDGTGEFDLSVRGSSMSGEGRHSLVTDLDSKETITVSTYRGDEKVGNSIPEPDILKIDVEGSEYEVLTGLRKTLSKQKPKIYCEIHTDILRRNGLHRNTIVEYLKDFNYSIESVYDRGTTEFIRAR